MSAMGKAAASARSVLTAARRMADKATTPEELGAAKRAEALALAACRRVAKTGSSIAASKRASGEPTKAQAETLARMNYTDALWETAELLAIGVSLVESEGDTSDWLDEAKDRLERVREARGKVKL